MIIVPATWRKNENKHHQQLQFRLAFPLTIVIVPIYDAQIAVNVNEQINYVQYEALRQIKEFHAGQCDQVVGHLVVEALQFDAPRLFGRHPNHFDDATGLFIDVRRVQGDGQSPPHEEDEREPKVNRVISRRFDAKMGGRNGI